MNYEILFRGKTNKDEWKYGDRIRQYRKNVIITYIYEIETGVFHKVIPETVGQYACINDKNGELIFKGDILDYRHECGALHVVEWLEDELGVSLSVDCSGTLGMASAEKIGNIHDNPELLEGNNELRI